MFLTNRIIALWLLCIIGFGCNDSTEDQTDQKTQGAAPTSVKEPEPAAVTIIAPEPQPAVLRLDTTAPITAEGVTLRWAAWGADDEWLDATAFVQEKLDATGRYLCEGGPLVKAVGDPGPRYANSLVLLFDSYAGPFKVGMVHLASIRTSVPPNRITPPGGPWSDDEIERANQYLVDRQGTGVQVVWSRWGREEFGNHWVQAYPYVGPLVANGYRFTNSHYDLPLSHPVKDRDKYMSVLLSTGQGEAVHFMMIGNSYFELAPDEQAQQSPVR